MEKIKWLLYNTILSLLGSRSVEKRGLVVPNPIKKYQWVFCSTIGELNSCKPLIKQLEKLGPLVLISDRDCYAEAYEQHFHNAVIVQINGDLGEVEVLAEKFPPATLYVCEIPCMPNDAPCRLSYGFLRYLKKLGARLYMVNGWLYEYLPSCKQDVIERKLFSLDYIRLFDAMTVQTNDVRDKLILFGADPSSIKVAGNMKFDAIHDKNIILKDTVSQKIIDQISIAGNQVFIAGCLADRWEYKLLVDAFKTVLEVIPSALMVLAPRHPEKLEQIESIQEVLQQANLKGELKSKVSNELKSSTQVLVLDTFGELRSYYSIANVSYVGRNHNILEPLAFGKPVLVISGWEKTYPSFPVYCFAREQELIFEISEESEELHEVLLNLMERSQKEFQENLNNKLKSFESSLMINMSFFGVFSEIQDGTDVSGYN